VAKPCHSDPAAAVVQPACRRDTWPSAGCNRNSDNNKHTTTATSEKLTALATALSAKATNQNRVMQNKHVNCCSCHRHMIQVSIRLTPRHARKQEHIQAACSCTRNPRRIHIILPCQLLLPSFRVPPQQTAAICCGRRLGMSSAHVPTELLLG
jgi:hypothetical protein